MNFKNFFFVFILLLAGIAPSSAQSSFFTYQGKLTDTNASPTGAYDFTFRLFDAVSGGSQRGADIVVDDVAVTAGVFAVNLDFGAPAFADGGPRYIEVAVRPGASTGAFTLLAPRRLLTSVPFAVKSLSATNADTSTNALQLGGTTAAQFVQTSDARLSDARNPLPNSANYIQNTTSPQASSNFNISGTGSANVFNATTQFTIGGSRVLFSDGNQNSFAGRNAGILNSSGTLNSFFGSQAGAANTAGAENVFVGSQAGFTNDVGIGNTFVGNKAGFANTQNDNTFVGDLAGFTNSTGSGNVFVGSQTGRNNTTGFTNVFTGASAGRNNTTGASNTFSGASSGFQNVSGNANAFYGYSAGISNSSGSLNSFFGYQAGQANSTGGSNTFIGYNTADGFVSGSNSTALGASANFGGSPNNATAIGAFSYVTQDNSLVLGSIAGVNTATADTRVAIGTTAPTFRFHVKAGNQDGIKLQNGGGDFQQIKWTNAADATTALISVGPVGGEDLRFFVNGADRLIIEDTGTVIINTLGAAGATALCRNASNQIATCSSSLRYKTNVNDFRFGLNIVRRLRPITFNWREGGAADLGLGAEDVAKVNELLVTRNANGEVEGVKYDRVGVVLVNAVNEQQEQIEAQRRENEALKQQLARQDATIREQQAAIEALTGLVCAQNRRAPFCKTRPKRK
ncbi:MAG: tail fiber domain-containing protein [Acidobacteria bacterium]|nr:tail fiber domain-containing protein [Acidobacteriota bacterium]